MLEILDLLLGPAQWRKLSGPAVIAAAFGFGLIGLVFAASGASLLLRSDARVVPLFMLCAGLAVLVDIAVGVTAFLRSDNESS